MHRGSIMEVTTINRVYSCGTTLRIVKNIDSVRHRARGSLVEPWASIRVVKTSVDTEGAVGGLASTVTPELVDLQELRTTSCKKSLSTHDVLVGCCRRCSKS